MFKVNGKSNVMARDYLGYDIVRFDGKFYVTPSLVRNVKHEISDVISPEFSYEVDAKGWVVDYRSEMVHSLYYSFEIDRKEFKHEMKRIKSERGKLSPLHTSIEADTLVELTVTLNEVIERIVTQHGISKYDVIDHVNRYIDSITQQ